jgi:hypothetical protein
MIPERSTDRCGRTQEWRNLRTVLAFVAVFVSAFFLGRVSADTQAAMNASPIGEAAEAALRANGAAGTEAPGLADVLRPTRQPGQ